MNYQTLKRTASALLILTLASTFAPGAMAAVPAKVSEAAKIYQSASADAKSLPAPKNLKVSVTAVNDGWAKISYKGKTAYIKLSKLTPTKKAKRYATRAASVFNSSGEEIGTLAKGDAVYLLGTLGDAYCVASGSGSIGFMESGTLSSKKPSTKKLTKIEKAIAVAGSLLGAKYALDDNPPNSFNCSSFVQYCMGKAGISMKNTAAKQAADSRYKKISSLSDLKMGDVLFFSESGEVDHSAIYLGDGKFIEASANAGQVQTNSLSDWYRSHFQFARRPK